MMVSNPTQTMSRAVPNGGQRSYNGEYMEAGKRAEKIVMDWLRSRKNTLKVNDLRDVPAMREADVDCSVTMRDGPIVFGEIKSDWWLGKSGKVLFEVMRINHTAPTDRAFTMGWTARTPATWLFYFAPQTMEIYHCRFNDFRAVAQAYTKEHRENLMFRTVATDNIKTTVNLLIPWHYCEPIFNISKLPEVAL